MVLTSKFDLLFKNVNLGHNLWTMRDRPRAFIFDMCIPCDKTFHIMHIIPNFFDLDLEVWPVLFKNFNLDHNLWTVRDGAFIFHMCIPCDKTLSQHTIIFYLLTLTLKFDLLSKNFNLGHNLRTVRDIFHMHFLGTRPFTSYHNFWPSDLDLEVWPTFQKL